MLIRIDNWLNRNTYRVWGMWVPPTGLLIALSLLLPVSLVVAQQDEPIDVTRLGTSNSFVAGGAKSREEVQQFMSKNRKEVEALLLQKDWKGNPQDIFDAVANGDYLWK